MKRYILVITGFVSLSIPTIQGQTQPGDGPVKPTAATATDPYQRAVSAGIAPAPVTPGNGSLLGYGNSATATHETESPVSVVSFKTLDQGTADEAAEDLDIMSLIITKKLEENFANQPSEYKLGIPMLLKTGGRSLEATYIEGFGVLFSLRVRFPLVASGVQEKEADSAQTPSQWEAARRALEGTETATSPGPLAPYQRPQPYDANLVETLKQSVLEVLPNVANLRNVAPDDAIVLIFTGPPMLTQNRASSGSGAEQSSQAIVSGLPRAQADESPDGVLNSGIPSSRRPRANQMAQHGEPQTPLFCDRLTMMTVRIKKSDAIDFAAKKLSEEQFSQTAQVTTYYGPMVSAKTTSDIPRLGSNYRF